MRRNRLQPLPVFVWSIDSRLLNPLEIIIIAHICTDFTRSTARLRVHGRCRLQTNISPFDGRLLLAIIEGICRIFVGGYGDDDLGLRDSSNNYFGRKKNKGCRFSLFKRHEVNRLCATNMNLRHKHELFPFAMIWNKKDLNVSLCIGFRRGKSNKKFVQVADLVFIEQEIFFFFPFATIWNTEFLKSTHVSVLEEWKSNWQFVQVADYSHKRNVFFPSFVIRKCDYKRTLPCLSFCCKLIAQPFLLPLPSA